MENFSSTSMAVAMVASFLLAAAGAKLAFAPQTRTRGILMIIAALVLFTNVMIWTV